MATKRIMCAVEYTMAAFMPASTLRSAVRRNEKMGEMRQTAFRCRKIVEVATYAFASYGKRKSNELIYVEAAALGSARFDSAAGGGAAAESAITPFFRMMLAYNAVSPDAITAKHFLALS